MSDEVPTKNVQYQAQINGGPVHTIQFKTGQYILAALASLASLDFEPADDFDQDFSAAYYVSCAA